jgi:hypothetical protein
MTKLVGHSEHLLCSLLLQRRPCPFASCHFFDTQLRPVGYMRTCQNSHFYVEPRALQLTENSSFTGTSKYSAILGFVSALGSIQSFTILLTVAGFAVQVLSKVEVLGAFLDHLDLEIKVYIASIMQRHALISSKKYQPNTPSI